ncbi:MAG TPA: DNA polymerase III subunit gamma/tau [Candidatus Acidoferrales bacterium]|nr:DNA polymerase III subunit gamma/tau [Candidatus Acidoferrales bacterium]
MSYTVLARKWRPRSFRELVGQEHVVRALSNALSQQRLHHAYLFTGTRGVGKTTLGRILAKCLNCEQGVSAEPCGRCGACQEIDQGRFMDLIEVDAASRTKVDDTRALLDNAQYAPGKGRFKIYLIDEVHMLSTHSFNALLKTLEEPPEHVKFLLATTDPQKLPVTVLSRCLQFNLHRLGADRIATHLATILAAEGVAFEPAALRTLGRAADGSVRDALSLLDQAIAYAGGRLTVSEVNAMLGTVDRLQVDGLLKVLAAGDAEAIWQMLVDWRQRSPDYTAILDALALRLQAIAFAQTFGRLSDDEEPVDPDLLVALSPATVQVYYQICLLGKRDFALAPDPASGFEMVVLRLHAFRLPSSGGVAAPGVAATAQPAAQQAGVSAASPAPVRTAPMSPAAVLEAPADDDWPMAVDPAVPMPAPGPADATAEDWSELVARLGLRGGSLELARHCALKSHANGRIVLELAQRQQALRRPAAEQSLRDALRQHLREPDLILEIRAADETPRSTPAQREADAQAQRQAEAEAAMREDAVVQALQSRLDARVQSMRPRDVASLNDGE